MTIQREAITAKVKNKLFKRSKGICEVCRVNPAQEIHHILPVYAGGKSNFKNLVELCSFCHEYVPGNYPDGYNEEFSIYQSNGGMCWGIMALGYWMGWQCTKGDKYEDYLECMQKFQSIVKLMLNKNLSFPFCVKNNLEVFK